MRFFLVPSQLQSVTLSVTLSSALTVILMAIQTFEM